MPPNLGPFKPLTKAWGQTGPTPAQRDEWTCDAAKWLLTNVVEGFGPFLITIGEAEIDTQNNRANLVHKYLKFPDQMDMLDLTRQFSIEHYDHVGNIYTSFFYVPLDHPRAKPH